MEPGIKGPGPIRGGRPTWWEKGTREEVRVKVGDPKEGGLKGPVHVYRDSVDVTLVWSQSVPVSVSHNLVSQSSHGPVHPFCKTKK